MSKDLLNDMFDVIDRQVAERKTRIVEYNQALRSPDSLWREQVDGKIYTFGFWHMPGGIVKSPRHKNGFHPYDYTIITDDEIKILTKVAYNTPKPLRGEDDVQT